jgi:hypothetical protein
MNYTQYLNEANESDAWTQYQARAAKVNKQMNDISKLLKKHYARAKSQKETDWGLSGDLVHVYDLLSEIIDFIK